MGGYDALVKVGSRRASGSRTNRLSAAPALYLIMANLQRASNGLDKRGYQRYPQKICLQQAYEGVQLDTMRLLTVVLLLAIQLQAADTIKVWLDLEKKTSIEQRFHSYISRELRALGDVEFVDAAESADYIISAVLMETRSKSGDDLGYAVATVLARPSMPYHAFQGENVPNDVISRIIQTIRKTQIKIESFALNVGSDLEATCNGLVARWDSEQFEAHRKIIRDIKKP